MFPVGDFVRRDTTPYVNWTFIAVNIAVFVYMLTLGTQEDQIVGDFRTSAADRFLFDWGFVPACVADTLGFSTSTSQAEVRAICTNGDRTVLSVFTAMFVHAGWAHIAGNMLFLWIFGDNVEDRVGHVRYVFFYSLCGIAAAATQTFMATDTIIPNVGASGAIAGVLGAYLFLHPTAMVQVIIVPLFFLPFFVPAVVLIGVWFITQVFSGFAEIGNATAGSGVAWWAHIGGFLAGALLIWFFKRRQRRRSLSGLT